MIDLGWWQHRPLVLALGLIRLARIGLDRLQGYGLKYDNSFQHTHLGMPGKVANTAEAVAQWAQHAAALPGQTGQGCGAWVTGPGGSGAAGGCW
jgi:hypothetical protein